MHSKCVWSKWFLLAIFGGGLGFAQTFTVVSQSGANLGLDKTLRVTLGVQYSGSALSNVVPNLIPPSCSNITLDGVPINLMDTTYIGYNNGTSTVLSAIPSWANGATKQVVFDIHLYDNPGTGQSMCDNVCSSGVNFELEFSGDGFSGLNAVPNGNLGMIKPSNNQFLITERIGYWKNGLPDGQFQATTGTYQLILDHGLPNLTVPGSRIFFYIDWRTPSPTGLFSLLDLPIKHQFCGIAMPSFFNSNPPVFDGVLIDDTGTFPSAGIGAGNVIKINSTLGGTVNNPAEGQNINMFDISDESASCGGTILNQIGYTSAPNPARITTVISCWLYGFALYVGVPQSCSGTVFAFGAPATDAEFLFIESDSFGNLSAEFGVPSEWKNGGDLDSDYQITWYLRRDNKFQQIFDQGSDGVKLTLDTDNVPFDTNSYLEARVRHLPTGSVVSFDSPIHGMEYDLSLISKANTEIPVDNYLDPGETYTYELDVTNASSDSATSLSVTSFIPNQPGVLAKSTNTALPGTLTSGSSGTADISFQMLIGDQTCTTFEYAYTVTHSRGNMVLSHTIYDSVLSNCEDTDIVYPPNPNGLVNFCGATGEQNCQTAFTKGTSAGWTYNVSDNFWNGSVSDPVDSGTYFTLTTPPVPVGSNPSFSLNHLPNFELNTSGGVVEYRTQTGATWGPWNDLIVAIEQFTGDDFYHALTFPNNLPSYLAGRRVFMYNNPPAQPVLIDNEPVSPNLFGSAQNIQFRFVFQAPYMDQRSTGASHDWYIDDFEFVSTQPLLDNVFGAPASISRAYCDPISFVLERSSSYNVRWYNSVSRLLADDPNHSETISGNNIAWINNLPGSPTSTTIYFAKIRDVNSNTTRVVPIEIIVPVGGVPPLTTMAPVWRMNALDNPFADLNDDNKIDMNDFIIRENNSVCD